MNLKIVVFGIIDGAMPLWGRAPMIWFCPTMLRQRRKEENQKNMLKSEYILNKNQVFWEILH